MMPEIDPGATMQEDGGEMESSSTVVRPIRWMHSFESVVAERGHSATKKWGLSRAFLNTSVGWWGIETTVHCTD